MSSTFQYIEKVPILKITNVMKTFTTTNVVGNHKMLTARADLYLR